MKSKSLTDSLLTAAGRVVFIIVALNLFSLLFELLTLKNFDNYSLSFKHGYFILNDEKVGINLFANLFALVIVSMIYAFYLSSKRRTLEENL